MAESKYFKLTGNFVATKGQTSSFPVDTNMKLTDIVLEYNTEGQVTVDLDAKTYTVDANIDSTKFPIFLTIKNGAKDDEQIGVVKFALSKVNATDPAINYSYEVTTEGGEEHGTGGENPKEPTESIDEEIENLPSEFLVKVGEVKTFKVKTKTVTYTKVEKDNENLLVEDDDDVNSKKITGKVAGTTVLTFKDENDENETTATVTVDKENGEALLELDQSSASIKENGEAITVNITSTVDEFTVESDNDNVVVAKGEDKTFTVTPAKPGESVVTVKVTSKSSVETSVTLNVTVVALPALTVTPDTVDFKVGKTQVFDIVTNQSDYAYVIEPSDIATFDKDSKTLSAIKQGTGKITFYVNKDQDGEISKVVTLNIAEADITKLEVSPTNPTIEVGGTLVLTIETNASDYSVSNTSTETVSFDKSTKTITATAVGSATLTFTAKYGEGEEVSKQVIVTVEAKPVEPTTLEVTTSTPLTVVKGDKKVFTVETNADDYSVELNNSTLADYDKATHTLTTKDFGNLSIKFSATKEGSTTVEKTIALEIVDTTLSATVTDLKVKVGEEVNFNIDSNILTETKVTCENEKLLTLAKNNNRVTVNGLTVGDTNIKIVARDKSVTIPVKVYVDTLLTVSSQPANIYVGKDIVLEINTNADSFTAVSEHVGIVGVTKEGSLVTLSSVSAGVSKITISAQAKGGDPVAVEWNINSILETTYTREEVDKILTDNNTTVVEKLNSFEHDKSEFGTFVNNLIAYNKAMNPNDEENVITEEKGAARNYNLYIQIKDAIETEDYLVFKSKFDMINMAYTAFEKEAFNEFALFKYDQSWASKWGELSLTTFQNLNTVICTLCNIKTRAASIDAISLDKSLDITKIELSEIGINNIKKYYTV